MAVTTYNELYTLAKDNEINVVYNKSEIAGVLNVRGTLQKEFIPDSTQDLKTYDIAIVLGEWQLSGGDPADLIVEADNSPLDPPMPVSNKTLAKRAMDESNNNPPDWIKIYSTNYNNWINLRINDISSISVI